MCIFTRNKKPLVAEEDITVVKVLGHYEETDTYVSPFRRKPVLLGGFQLPEIENGVPVTFNVSHYCVEYGYVFSYGVDNDNFNIMTLLDNGCDYLLVECRIPKGTEYFIDDLYSEKNMEYASKSLYVTDKVVGRYLAGEYATPYMDSTSIKIMRDFVLERF